MIYNFPLLAKILPDCPNGVCGWCELIQLGQNVINFLIQISTALAVAFIIYGGIMMMIYSTNPERLQRSREIIKAAVIGVIIVAASWVILNTFFHLLTGNLNWPWDQVRC
jgi:uncharacterized BrkB/YihY/UPF0761 family membrane protein